MRELAGGGPPRPLAGLPLDQLQGDLERLTKAWLAGLIAARPLEHAATLPMPALVERGPAIFTAAVQALGDDAALARLAAATGPIGVLAAAEPEAAVWAVEALRRVIWAALLDELRRPSVEQLSELADRLSHVCSTLTAASLRSPGRQGVQARRLPAAAVPPTEQFAPPVVRRAWKPIAKSRSGEWVAAIEQLATDEHGGRPFAVLLVEVDQRERLAASDEGGELAEAIDHMERKLRARVRGDDRLWSDEAGRWWVVSPGSDGRSAYLLALALAVAPEDMGKYRGAPLRLAVGRAIYPENGAEASSLIEFAEDSLLAVRASGVGVAPLEQPETV